MRRPYSGWRSHRGTTLVEAIMATAVLGIMTLVIMQVQVLSSRQIAVNLTHADTDRAIRQSLIWLMNDVLSSREASVASGTLKLCRTWEGVNQVISYHLEDGDLVRSVYQDSGSCVEGNRLDSVRMAHGITHFAPAYDADRYLVSYAVTAEGSRGVPLAIEGLLHLRSAAD